MKTNEIRKFNGKTNKFKGARGITLIALIVSIIVLLILARSSY